MSTIRNFFNRKLKWFSLKMENSSVRFINLQILRQLVKSKRMKLTDIMIIPDSIYIIIGEVDP